MPNKKNTNKGISKKLDLSSYEKHLKKYRLLIDKIDRQLLALLKKRFYYAPKIAVLKFKYHQPFYQKQRWIKMLKERLVISNKYSLDQKMVKKILTHIHVESIKLQKKHVSRIKK